MCVNGIGEMELMWDGPIPREKDMIFWDTEDGHGLALYPDWICYRADSKIVNINLTLEEDDEVAIDPTENPIEFANLMKAGFKRVVPQAEQAP
jgi:hypothetical protein